MRPALSIVFFTTLSGAGYGLLFWLGVSMAQGRESGSGAFWASLLALTLVSAGLLCSLLHLGQPQRAWRALSQWRTSWLSREGVIALVTYGPAMAMTIIFWRGTGAFPHGALIAVGIATSILSLSTVSCTAMIYGSLKPIPAWRHRLVLPVYWLLALLSGAALAAPFLSFGTAERLMLIGLAVAAAIAKLAYWRAIDRAPLPDRSAAVGLKGRTVRVFEAPHTETNYITREFAFRLARSHAGKLRLVSAVLLAVVPGLVIAASMVRPGSPELHFIAAAASILTGAFVERWLFFAEARHVVTAYY